MPQGPGKYDDACTQARRATHADGIVLIVLNGKHGNGFSVQAPASVTEHLPDMLRSVAKQIEDSLSSS